jgi:hypothetical protein
MKAAAEAIHTGRAVIPLRCAFCRSPCLQEDLDRQAVRTSMDVLLNCVTCGRATRLSTARARRRRELRAFIIRGVDIRRERAA